MFQYAIARALSERYQTAFSLNRSWFDQSQGNATPRELQLSLLNIKNIPFTDAAFPKKLGKIARILQPLLPVKSLVIYQRNAFDFDPAIFKLKNVSAKDVYLSGYWQAFPYIDAIREQLKKEFRTKSEISESYRDYLQKIHSSESVMIHIRRGDYVHSPAAAQYHGTLPIHYYRSAIQELLSAKPNAHFFIFSDDLIWAKEALGASAQKTYIEHASAADAAAQELQLMFACKHHIIANSSLSWWGAWLRQDAGGLVFAPNRWINDQHLDLSNLLPAKWKKISIE